MPLGSLNAGVTEQGRNIFNGNAHIQKMSAERVSEHVWMTSFRGSICLLQVSQLEQSSERPLPILCARFLNTLAAELTPKPRSALRPEEIANSLPPADHGDRSAIHQHLSRPWTRIVVRGQRHPVRSSV